MERTAVEERFWSKVDRSGGPDACWLWTGAPIDGYGTFTVSTGVSRRAHRVAYELQVGPIPAGLEIDHLCRVKLCVNVKHLEAVTHAENLRRAAPYRVGSTKPPRVKPPLVKVSKRDPFPTNAHLYAEVRRRDISISALAKQLGLSRIVVGARLNNLDGPSVAWRTAVLDACDAIEGGVPTG